MWTTPGGGLASLRVVGIRVDDEAIIAKLGHDGSRIGDAGRTSFRVRERHTLREGFEDRTLLCAGGFVVLDELFDCSLIVHVMLFSIADLLFSQWYSANIPLRDHNKLSESTCTANCFPASRLNELILLAINLDKLANT